MAHLGQAVRIDEPPLAADLLRAEEARRLQLRAASPAAEAVGLRNPGGAGRELCRLAHRRRLQVVYGMDLTPPVGEVALPEAIHPRQKRVGLQLHCTAEAVGRDEREVRHAERAVADAWLGVEDESTRLRHVVRRDLPDTRTALESLEPEIAIQHPALGKDRQTHHAARIRREVEIALWNAPLQGVGPELAVHPHRAVGLVGEVCANQPDRREVARRGEVKPKPRPCARTRCAEPDAV